MAEAISWNPTDWVQVPVQCALSWAFKPDPAKIGANVEVIRTEIGDKGIGPVIEDFSGVIEGIPVSDEGCLGPPLAVDLGMVKDTFYLFNACDEMAPVAAKTSVFIGFVVAVSGGLAVIRMIAAGFGYDFRMRATTSEG